MATKKHTPTHPGEMLLKEFLQPLGISQYRLAKELDVPQIRISEIIRGKRGITVDTALRLARYFTMSAEFWLNTKLVGTSLLRSIDVETVRVFGSTKTNGKP